MQVTETLSDGLKRGYSVVVPAADIASRRSKRMAELGRTVRIPGFRPGKVPATVLNQRFGPGVTAEILEASVGEATNEVITGRGLRLATQPRIELVSVDPAQDLRFTVELELFPDITLPDFAAIEITRQQAVPDAADVERTLANLAARQRVVEPVAETRPVEKGEILTIDFAGSVDGVAFPGGTAANVDVEIGGAGFIPGFAEQLEGLSPGESRTIEVTFPDPYAAPELAGKAASFAITAKELKRALVPAVDEALATKLGFEGLDDLTKAVTRSLQNELDQLARLDTKRQLLDVLARTAVFVVPQGMVEGEFAQIWERVEADRKQGKIEADDVGKDDDTLRAEYRAIAERRVRLGLLMAEIGRVHDITVAEAELNRAIRTEASRYPGQEQKIVELFRKNPEAVARLRGPILEEKIVNFILELARVTWTRVTAGALAAAAQTGATQTGATQTGATAEAPAAEG